MQRLLTQVGTNFEDHQYLFDSNSSQVLLQGDEPVLGKRLLHPMEKITDFFIWRAMSSGPPIGKNVHDHLVVA